MNSQQHSLESVIDKVINSTIKNTGLPGYNGLGQMTVNYAAVNNLIDLSSNNNASARAIALLKIDQLKGWLAEKPKTTATENWKAHYAYLLNTIQTYREHPGKFESEKLLPAPPGQPIGTDMEPCGWNN